MVYNLLHKKIRTEHFDELQFKFISTKDLAQRQCYAYQPVILVLYSSQVRKTFLVYLD